MERRFTATMSYDGAVPGNACRDEDGMNARYAFGADIDNNTYVLRATPQAAQDDPLCEELTINQAGVRTESGTGTVNECWQ